MFLTRMVYASTANNNFTPKDIEDILIKARQSNTKEDITGILCFSRNYFIQCIEGTRTKVNDLYHKILNDDRHSNIILLDYKEISEREFGYWSMSYVPESKLTTSINLKYSGSSIFNPYKMSGQSALNMLVEFKGVLKNVT